MKFFGIFLVFLLIFCVSHKIESVEKFEYFKVEKKYNNKKFYGKTVAKDSTILSFQSEGKIVYFPFSKGDFVKKGQVIAKLDGVLYSIKKEEEKAKLQEFAVAKDKQKRYYDRLDILHKEGAISDNDWESAFYELKIIDAQIKSQKEKINYLDKELSFSSIVAPYDGFISEKFSDMGYFVKFGAPVVSFISSYGMQVEIMLDELNIESFKIRNKVSIKILDKNYLGEISHISKSALKTGGFLVKISVLNPTGLMEGLSAEVEVFDDKKEILIPINSIFKCEGEDFVLVLKRQNEKIGILKKNKIKIGKIYSSNVQIVDGLIGNETILLNPNSSFEGMKVKI
ncbi:MAG: efflux RND transporter periplasmic adaptor subunit [Candidatus Gastranaerophilales bacterium]|nr:efflux RND transporter periplasmic adaptor subunit [Candidatus Gastranaerophilales bacterium]